MSQSTRFVDCSSQNKFCIDFVLCTVPLVRCALGSFAVRNYFFHGIAEHMHKLLFLILGGGFNAHVRVH